MFHVGSVAVWSEYGRSRGVNECQVLAHHADEQIPADSPEWSRVVVVKEGYTSTTASALRDNGSTSSSAEVGQLCTITCIARSYLFTARER
jgi:hypothetical protein